MPFGGEDIWTNTGQLDQESINTLVNRALDADINFFNTANIYSYGPLETLLGKALEGKRHDAIIATKVFGRMGDGPNQIGFSRVHIRQQIEGSLKRLGTDHIDLYQIHGFDPLTDWEDVLRTLDDVVRAGMVRYIGCCIKKR